MAMVIGAATRKSLLWLASVLVPLPVRGCLVGTVQGCLHGLHTHGLLIHGFSAAMVGCLLDSPDYVSALRIDG